MVAATCRFMGQYLKWSKECTLFSGEVLKIAQTAKQVKHPYIIRNKRVRGGVPIIRGTGIRVLDVAIRYEIMGMTPEDIELALLNLDLSQIHDALSYYYEHKSEMDKEWKDAIKKVHVLKKGIPSVLEKKIGKIKNLHR